MKKIIAFVCASGLFAALLAGCNQQPEVATPEQVQAAKASQAESEAQRKQLSQGRVQSTPSSGRR